MTKIKPSQNNIKPSQNNIIPISLKKILLLHSTKPRLPNKNLMFNVILGFVKCCLGFVKLALAIFICYNLHEII